MTFYEWWINNKYKYQSDDGWERNAAKDAWNAALNESADIIGDMEGCTEVTSCRKDGLKKIEKLR